MESGIEREMGGIASIRIRQATVPKLESLHTSTSPRRTNYTILGFPERGYLLNRQVVVRTVGL